MKDVRKKIWCVLALNVFVLISMLILMPSLYETNDDVAIREFINGSRGVRDPHLVYQNVVLGIIYKVFYHFTTYVPWYDIIQYLVVFVAFLAVSYLLFCRSDSRLALAVSVILQIFFAFECYVRPQYTKTAGIAAAAGMILLFWAVEEPRRSDWRIPVGIGLACTGFMYRTLEALICMVLMSVLGVHFLLDLKIEKQKEILKKSLGVFGALAVFIAVLFLVDHLAYETDPMWKSYKEYNELRTELLDYGFPDHKGNEEAYDRIGINKNAFRLYSSGNYYDPDKFNVQVMEQLVRLKPERKFTVDTIKSFIDRMPEILKNTYTFWCVCILLALYLIWGSRSPKVFLCLLLEGGIVILFYLYLFSRGRYGVNRVDVGIWYSVSLALIWFLPRDVEGKKRKASVVFTALLCAAALLAGQKTSRPYLWYYHQEDIAKRAALRQVLEALGMDKEHLYLIKCGYIPEYNCYGTFDTMPGEILSNLCWLGGWDCNTAGQQDALKRYGAENPFRDVVDREDIILVDNDIDLTVRYIRKYYNKNAKAIFLRTVGNVNLYQIVS